MWSYDSAIRQRGQKQITWGLFPVLLSANKHMWNFYSWDLYFLLSLNSTGGDPCLLLHCRNLDFYCRLGPTEIWRGFFVYFLFLQSLSSLSFCPALVRALPWSPGVCCWALFSLIKSHRMTPRMMREPPTRKTGMMMISYCWCEITG